jgi:uncharacterized protein YecT (DUF1311 family)
MRAMIVAALLALAASLAHAYDTPLYAVQDCSKLMVQMELNQCAQANSDPADRALNVTYKQVLLWLPTQRRRTI